MAKVDTPLTMSQYANRSATDSVIFGASPQEMAICASHELSYTDDGSYVIPCREKLVRLVQGALYCGSQDSIVDDAIG